MQAYLDNAGFAEAGSLAQAKEFSAACRMLLLTPEESGDRDGQVKMRLAQFERDLAEVTAWIRQHAPAAATALRTSEVSVVNFNRGRE